MSDLSSGGNQDQVPAVDKSNRPGMVTFLAVLIFIAAFAQVVAAVALIVLAFRPAEVQQLFGASVSDWYWILTAVLDVILALIYIWMGRGLLSGDAQAWMLLNLIAIINIIFSVFQFSTGIGWLTLLVNVVILALNNTTKVRLWFGLI